MTVSPDPHDFSIRFHDSHQNPNYEVTILQKRSVGLHISTPKQVKGLVTGEPGSRKHYLFAQTELDVGETVHGLGERFGLFSKLAQNVEVWNEDGGTSSDQAYKNISFWISSKGVSRQSSDCITLSKRIRPLL